MSKQAAKPKGKIVLKKNKAINRIWHQESALVFKSSKEKLVIGKFENGEIRPLDDEILELCAQWKFRYDTSLVEEVDEGDEGDEGDEVEEEDEEDGVEEVSKPEEGEEDGVEEVSKPEEEVEEKEEVEEVVEEINEEIKPKQKTKSKQQSTEDLSSDPTLQSTDFKLDVVFTGLTSSTQLLQKNLRFIVSNLQKKMDTEKAALTQELESTKTSLTQLTAEHEDTKAKLAKIRTALGF